ncbi:bactofilin family protein [Rugamonas apoptosis]|uniref:Polymer-forming cytoskeletal protein n=1 Tax=Rugamonas apoptosis TaxID=2758570 RepID=A0A7W2FBG9_9BURK|nr:polymer-forming cytoskeletal protein [Rugamonas apoptosis]MBA5688539.1 polymer-forming cytoskeletal protein [Rugamonas apoptosis]
MFAKARNPMESLIGPATRIDGHLLFRGGLRIEGKVVGSVCAEPGHGSYLVVSEHGCIDGEVRCDHLIVNGEIRGAVHVAERLEIQPKARIVGDVYYKVLEMHGGAQVLGQLALRDEAGVAVQGTAIGVLESINCAKGL